MTAFKKYIIAVIIFTYSIGSQAVSFLEYKKYDKDMFLSIYQKYVFEKSPEFIARFGFCGQEISTDYDSSIEIGEDLMSKEDFLLFSKKIILPIKKVLEPYKKSKHETVRMAYENQGIIYDKTLAKQVFTQLGYNGADRSKWMSDDKIDFTFHTLIDARKLINYKQAADYAYKNLFTIELLENLEGIIKHTHKILAEELYRHDDSKITNGEYRQGEIVIFPEYNSKTLTDQARKFYKQKMNLIKKRKDSTLTDDDRIMFAEYQIGVALDYRNIPTYMEQFCSDFIKCINLVNDKKLSPVAFAAWAHMELVRIHPFEDANGRLSRIVTNAILMHYGYPPIIFQNDKSYTKAINEDIIHPGSFAEYITESIVWTSRQLDNPEIGLTS